MTAEAGGPSFLEALHGRVEANLDACTRCGKCVTACPMIEPAGIDTGSNGANAPAIVTGLIDLIGGGAGTPASHSPLGCLAQVRQSGSVAQSGGRAGDLS